MTELHPTRLGNNDDAYWDARAARVAAEAMRRSPTSVGQSSATWIAASLLFAAGLAMMLVSSRGASSSSGLELRIAVAPADDVGRALAVPEAPPAIVALLSGGAR